MNIKVTPEKLITAAIVAVFVMVVTTPIRIALDEYFRKLMEEGV